MGRVASYGTYGTEKATLFTNRFYRADGSKRGIVFCHGLNGQAWHPVNFPDPTIEELVARGFPVFSPDLGGTATWGNDTAQTKISDAKTYLQSIGAKAGGILLWCGSMGTLAGLNFIRSNPTLVSAVAVALPAVDLADLHDNAVARGITTATVESAYGGSLATYNTARPAHNPSENTSSYTSLAGKIKLWYSNDDPTTIPARVTAFSAATGIPTVNMGNQGGHVFGPSFASSVANFLESFN